MDRTTATFKRQISIAAPASRVWRALCDPGEVAQWDAGVRFPIDPPVDYPQPGQRVRWRTTGRVFRILLDEPVEVVPERRLRANLSLGPARYDETYTIRTAVDESAISAGHCLLLMVVTLSIASVPGRRIAFRHFSADTPTSMVSALTSIKSHCEALGA
ncbi:MAG: SRPBCC family protein [Alkalispirochaeta sp.]